MFKGYARARRPVGLPESDIGRVPKWRLKGTGKLFSRFLHCVEVSHNLDRLDVLYRASTLIATFNFTGITFEVSVLDIAAHAFVHLLSSSVSLVLYGINKLLNFLH